MNGLKAMTVTELDSLADAADALAELAAQVRDNASVENAHAGIVVLNNLDTALEQAFLLGRRSVKPAPVQGGARERPCPNLMMHISAFPTYNGVQCPVCRKAWIARRD